MTDNDSYPTCPNCKSAAMRLHLGSTIRWLCPNCGAQSGRFATQSDAIDNGNQFHLTVLRSEYAEIAEEVIDHLRYCARCNNSGLEHCLLGGKILHQRLTEFQKKIDEFVEKSQLKH